MADSEKLARWQGWTLSNIEGYDYQRWLTPDKSDHRQAAPNYLNDDAAAMSLLDTLVEKGFAFKLVASRFLDQGTCIGYVLSVLTDDEDGMNPILDKIGNTSREAIVSACLEVARKEDV